MNPPQQQSFRVEHLRRGDVWYVKMGRMDGAGLRKIIPCLILQIDEVYLSGAFNLKRPDFPSRPQPPGLS